jgi:protein-S-isoprenylcysteine O-methyltransferase Ste14
MTSAILNYVVPGLWWILLTVWAIAASRTKAIEQSEPLGQRAVHVGLMLLGGLLTLTPWVRFGPLGWQFLPATQVVAVVGCVTEALGFGFAIAARFYLGSNWSGKVTLKSDHELVRTGPYRLSRHPIYTGILVAFAGTTVAYGVVGGLVGTAIVFAAFLRKIRQEEAILVRAFGGEYERYRLEAKALIPLIL